MCIGDDSCIAGVCRTKPTWDDAVALNVDTPGYYSNLSVLPNGDAVVIWVQRESEEVGNYSEEIWLSRYALSSGWSTPELVKPGSGLSVANTPLVVGDSAGAITVVWVERRSTVYAIHAKRFEPGTGWGDALQISRDEDGDAFSPLLMLDAESFPVVLWPQEADGEPRGLWLTRYSSSAGFGDPVRVDRNAGSGVMGFDIAADATGKPVIGWAEFDGVSTQVFSRTARRGELTPVTPAGAPQPGRGYYVDLAFNQVGAGGIIWSLEEATHDTIMASNAQYPCGWDQPKQLARSAEGEHAYVPRFALSGTGRGLGIWYQSVAGRFDVWKSDYTAAGGFGDGTPLTQDIHNALAPDVAMDGDGSATVFWTQQDTTDFSIFRVWAAQMDATGVWTTPTIKGFSSRDFGPRFQYAANGDGFLAWYGGQLGAQTVWAQPFH